MQAKSQACFAYLPDTPRRLEQVPKPPGRSLMSARGNAAPRGMTAHDRIRLTGPFAECVVPHDSPGWENPPGLTSFGGVGGVGKAVERLADSAGSARTAKSAPPAATIETCCE